MIYENEKIIQFGSRRFTIIIDWFLDYMARAWINVSVTDPTSP
jgi:hypothetical protein